jgi:cell division protein FtsN
MTQYSRTVIPGRTRSAAAGDLDPRMFGPTGDPPEPVANDIKVRARGEPRGEGEFSRLPGQDRAEADEGGPVRGQVLLIGAVVVVAIFGFVLWNAYSQGLRGPEDEAAPMLVSSGPFKTGAPEGEDASPEGPAPLDAEVFSRLESPGAREAVREAELEGGGEAPRDTAPPPPSDAPAFVAPSVPPIRTTAAPTPATTQPATIRPVTNPAVEPVRTVVAPTTEAAPGTPISLVPKAAGAPVAPAQTSPSPTPATMAARVEAPKPASRTFASNGPYVVQLAAPATQSAAEAEWARRVTAAKDLFDGAEKLIVRADVNGKTVWRVRVGSFGTAEEADAFCAALKGKGGDCFRAAR